MIFDLLPTSSMDSSILTPVLIGVLLVWLFQETLGWGLSGLVVPGYLASVLVIDPAAGALVLVEAVLTTLVVRALSDFAPRWWPWSPFFGRERFFHIVLVATAVRLALEADGGLLDQLAGEAAWAEVGDLNAIGLVLVPLLANTLWRAGLAQGVPRIGVPILLTWALLELVLIPYTNISLSSFQLTFEDLALDFEGSAKAHLLVLVGAGLAAGANLYWGWDMGGIIVPGLLTLIWLDPTKLGVTLAEAVVVAGLLTAVVSLPGVRRWNLAGGRTLMLGFVLDYILRVSIAWTPWHEAGIILSARDLQGFGYLLPTLMAVRMHQHREIARVVLPVAVVSLAGLAVGSGLGLGVRIGLDGVERPAIVAAPTVAAPTDALPRLVDLAGRGGALPPGGAGRWMSKHPGQTVGVAGTSGALHARSTHRVNAVVVTTLGPPALAQAAWALAEVGEARGVALCAPRAEACAELVASLRAEGLSTWRVEDAAGASVLRFRHALEPTLTLRELSDTFGEVGIEAEQDAERVLDDTPMEVVLQLDLAARLQAAAQLFAPVEEGAGPTGPPRLDEAVLRQADAAQLEHVLPTLVLEPWMAWYADGSADALEAARRAAAAVDLQLSGSGDRSLLADRYWYASLHRAGAARVFYVPDEGLQPGSAALAETLARSLDAAAVVVDHHAFHPVGPTPARRPAHIAFERIVEEIARRDRALETVTVRGLRDIRDPGVDAVLHTGRVQTAQEAIPEGATEVRTRLLQGGFPPRVYDGSAGLVTLTDAGILGRPLTQAATGGEHHVTLHGSTRLRDAFSSILTPNHPLERVVTRAGLPRADLDLDALVAQIGPGTAVLSPDILDAHQRLVTRGRAVDLADLRWNLRRAGLEAALQCTPELGCRWLRATRCAPGACAGVLLPLHGGAAGATPTGDLDRLLFGLAPLPIAWEGGR